MITRLFIFSVIPFLFSCAGTQFVDTSKLPDTYQCTYMKEICDEAREYERTYNAMSSEEKKEFENILNAYRNQCNNALKMCKKSK